MGNIGKIQGTLFASSLCDALVSRYYGKSKISLFARIAFNLYNKSDYYSKYTDLVQSTINSALDNYGLYEEQLASDLAKRAKVLRGYSLRDLYKLKTKKLRSNTAELSTELNYEICLARANAIALLYPELSIALASFRNSSLLVSTQYENYFAGKILIILIQSYVDGKTDLEITRVLSRVLKAEINDFTEEDEERSIAIDKIRPLANLLSDIVSLMERYDPKHERNFDDFDSKRTELLNSKNIFGYELAVAIFYFFENKDRDVDALAADINWHQNCDIGVVSGIAGALWGARNGTVKLPCNLEFTLEGQKDRMELAGKVYQFRSVKDEEILGKFSKLVQKVKGFFRW